MLIKQFDISNFKGIGRATIALEDKVPGNIVTLVGLNESGKTSILEALSNFGNTDKELTTLLRSVQAGPSNQDIIPQSKKAAFTGTISISATLEFEEIDIKDVEDYLLIQDFVLDRNAFPKSIVVSKTLIFEDSTFKSSTNTWAITFRMTKKGSDSAVVANAIATSTEDEKKLWQACVGVLTKRLPQMIFFPTFLFNFPDRIYLDVDEGEINIYYRKVMQDVLDSQGEKLSIQKHIIDRVGRLKNLHPNEATFPSFLFGREEKKLVDAVLQRAASEMTRVIFGSWNEMFRQSVTGKRVAIDWSIDNQKKNSVYIEISIIDGEDKFSISERSLGFRWFFSFLLFTKFRSRRSETVVFLFDEPAANLHSRAQIKLLQIFDEIAVGKKFIIYSTHSHYMVNPKWLEKTYVIENDAISGDLGSFTISKNNIKATSYRRFVGSHSGKTSYFQPILDALEVEFSPLISAAQAIIVEGKFDYFPLLFFRSKFSIGEEPVIFPAGGASRAGNLISLFRGFGVRFRVLLDDDGAGRKSKKQYIRDYLLSEDEVVTLGDIDPSLSDKSFESFYQTDVTDAIKKRFETEKIEKDQFSLFFQELLSKKEQVSFPDTEAALEKLHDWLKKNYPRPS